METSELVKRIRREAPGGPGEAPYYFTWTLVLSGGERVPQYDERGRQWRIGHPTAAPRAEIEEILKRVRVVEVHPHPAFGPNAPGAKLVVAWPWAIEYDPRLPMPAGGGQPRAYHKQGLTLISEGNGLLLRAVPADLETAGNPPDASYDFALGVVGAGALEARAEAGVPLDPIARDPSRGG
jgi:hypothetical protein